MTERRGGVVGSGGDVSLRRCSWCGRRLPDAATTGRPRTYCRRSCRQRAFEARRRLTELDWGESRIRDLRSRVDDLSVTLAAVADLTDEMRRDVTDDRSWDDDLRADYVERLSVLLAGTGS